MFEIPDKIKKGLTLYINELKKTLKIKQVILFGSYANGDYDKESDIDIAVIAENYPYKERVENIKMLLHKSRNLKLNIEPIPFTVKDLKRKNYFIEDILKNGIRIY
ncbi:MAG: nucleotidyltransferase domain-containing protein [Candidatus Hydrogenedentota bacterium]